MAKIVLFGDRSVERLHYFCAENPLRVPGHVQWCFKSGLRTDRMDHALFSRLLHQNADVVVLNVGGNDITATSFPIEIVSRIQILVDNLKDSGVKIVYICEILARGEFEEPGLTKERFENQIKYINKKLAKKFKEYLIRFNDIKYCKDYHTDKVHLNTSGHKKFRARLQRVLF
jgi:lysophospholipase L1-like esterase